MKKDHPKVPVTIPETVDTAKSCFAAGAGGIHFHMRDENGKHILDSKMCLKALEKLKVLNNNQSFQGIVGINIGKNIIKAFLLKLVLIL